MSESQFPNVTPAPVLAGKCYICHQHPGTEDAGLGGKLCPGCAENARQVLRKHALSRLATASGASAPAASNLSSASNFAHLSVASLSQPRQEAY